MTRIAYQRAGSVLFNSYAGNTAAQQRRLSRETLQRMMESLWTPLIKHAGNPEVAHAEYLLNLRNQTGYAFTCQVNGLVGDTSLLEATAGTLLGGFDVVRVSLDAESTAAGSDGFRGQFTLAHTRRFVDWEPRGTLVDAIEHADKMPRLLTVPFWSHAEVMPGVQTPVMTHVILRSPLMETITSEVKKCGDSCPELKALLTIEDPHQRLFTLHRIAAQK